MPDFKVRRKILAQSGLQVGSTGASFADILFGSGCVNCPSATASTVVVGTGSLTSGFSAGDTVFLTPIASLTTGMALIGACCVSGCISASWYCVAGANVSASADVHCHYLIFS